MIINIPPIECYIRKEYLYNLEAHHGELVEGTAFAIKSLQGTALLFLVMTDIGAVYDKIPISALVPFDKPEAPHIEFHVLQLWDCFSYSPHVCQFMFLKGKRAKVLLKDGTKREGIYRFTIDWDADMSGGISTSFAEEPSQHKCAHVIELSEGYFCAYPNNRILWAEPSMVAEPFKKIPDYKLNMRKYHCESHDKWATSDDDSYFYGIKSESNNEDVLIKKSVSQIEN
jgi:hypothetical protein